MSFLLGLVIPALYALSVLSYLLLTGLQIGFNWWQHTPQDIPETSSSALARQLEQELDAASKRLERSSRAVWWQRLLQGGS